MLKQIHLENWKSFQKADLYLDPLTILIGTNASGKSNVIDALDFLTTDSIEVAIRGDKFDSGLRGGLEWIAKKPENNFTLIENLPKLMASGTLGQVATKGLIERSLHDEPAKPPMIPRRRKKVR